MNTAENKSVDSIKDFGSDTRGLVDRWCAEISRYEREFKNWQTSCDKIVKRYRNEKTLALSDFIKSNSKPNVFWANIETLKPLISTGLPKPYVSRKFKNKAPVARFGSMLLERVLRNELDEDDLVHKIHELALDWLLCGRGQLWERYEATTTLSNHKRRLTGVSVDESITQYIFQDDNTPYSGEIGKVLTDEQGPFIQEQNEEVIEEKTVTDFIHYTNFGHTVASRWENVTAVWKIIPMTKDEVKKRFGAEAAAKINFSTFENSDHGQREIQSEKSIIKKADIYEIWDKATRRVIWIEKSYREAPLEVLSDPLGLEGFFPCPRPLYGITTTESLIPVPDYLQAEDLYEEIDSVSARITAITDTLRVNGFCDARWSDKLNEVYKVDSKLIPIPNFSGFKAQGGARDVIEYMPIEQAASVLNILYSVKDRLMKDLFERTGLSDIVRGQTSPTETATAQQLKGHFNTLRVSPKQTLFLNYLRDIIRIKAEIISEQFSMESIFIKGGAESIDNSAQLFIPAVKMLRKESIREYKIKVETQATAGQDEAEELQKRMEFLKVLSGMLKDVYPIMQASPEMSEILIKSIMFVIRAFKTGRELEETLESGLDNIMQSLFQQQQQQQQKPDPGLQAKMLDAQTKSQIAQMQLQNQTAHDQAKLELERLKTAGDLAIEKEKSDNDLKIESAKLSLKNKEMLIRNSTGHA